MTVRFLLVALFLWVPLGAQHRVNPQNMYERVLCVVPMIGSGSAGDPIRPQYAPLPLPLGTPPSRDGIIAFSFQISDDGKLALVEFVAFNRGAFKGLLADTNPNIKVFRKGKDKRQDIEAEFKKHKKDVDLNTFGVLVP